MFSFFKNIYSHNLFLSWIIWGLLIVSTSFTAYFNSYNNEYIIDDVLVIRDDPKANSIRQIKKILSTHYWELETKEIPQAPATYVYRPFTILTYAITASLWSASPQTHHLINIFLHVLTSFLVFLTIAILGKSLNIAGLTGLIFSIHPIHVDPINVLTSRSEILVCLMCLITLAAMHKIFEKEKLILWYPLAWISWFLALCSKESAVLLLPLLFLFIVITKIETFNLSNLSQKIKQLFLPFVLPIISLVIPAISYFGLRYYAIGSIGTNSGSAGKIKVDFLYNPLFDLPFYERFLTGIKIIGRYISLHVYPYPLLVDYSYNVIPLVKSVWDFTFLVSCLEILLVIALMIYFRKEKLFVIGIIFWLMGIFLFSNIAIPFGTIFGERLMYFPSLGFCLALATLLEKYNLFLKEKLHSSSRNSYQILRNCSYVIGSLVIFLSVAYCIYSNPFYKDSQTSLLRAIKLTNGQGAAHWFSLAQIYIDYGDQEKACIALEKCVEIYSYDVAFDQLTHIYFVKGDKDKALFAARKTVELVPDWWPYRKQLAIMLTVSGNTDEAIKEFKKVLIDVPNNSTVHISLGYLLEKQGDLSQAEYHFQQALKGDSPQIICYKVLAEIYTKQGNIGQAVSCYESFIKKASVQEAKEVLSKLQELKNSLENKK